MGDLVNRAAEEVDVEARLRDLEREWRRAYEAGNEARSDYRSLATCGVGSDLLEMAEQRLDRCEATTARISAKIERLEGFLLRDGSLV